MLSRKQSSSNVTVGSDPTSIKLNPSHAHLLVHLFCFTVYMTHSSHSLTQSLISLALSLIPFHSLTLSLSLSLSLFSLSLSLSLSLSHSLYFIHSFIHKLTNSLVHSSTTPLAQPLSNSLSFLLTHSLPHPIHSLRSLTLERLTPHSLTP